MRKAWSWIVGVLAALGTAVLVFLGLRSRHHVNAELAEQAAELARKEADRERAAAERAVVEAHQAASKRWNAALQKAADEAASDAERGDLADAFNSFRAGAGTDGPETETTRAHHYP